MNKTEAMDKVRIRVLEATQLITDLEKIGRMPKGISKVREEMAKGIAEFVGDNWVSFDATPVGEEAAKATDDATDGEGDGDES